jgi:hypothetical protein
MSQPDKEVLKEFQVFSKAFLIPKINAASPKWYTEEEYLSQIKRKKLGVYR